VHAPEIFFTVETYAFHTAYLVILLTWLYRHVRRELRRDDARQQDKDAYVDKP
jgi:hypothetical protein